jgi:HSP20 family protein
MSKEMRRYHEEIEQAFSELIHTPWGRFVRARWQPPVDLYETESVYVLFADIPGVDPKRISLTLDNQRLTLCGDRTSVVSVGTGQYLLIERTSGRFCRTLTLAKEVTPEKITTHYENGIFQAIIPKKNVTTGGTDVGD